VKRLLLFAKRPRAGKVKTRLVPRLGRDRALALYRAFLDDQLRFLRSLAGSYDVELWLDGVWSPIEGVDPRPEGLRLRQQCDGDLGRRLARAFATCHAEGASATVVIGVDSPTLPGRLVRRAFEALDGGDPVVLSPAADGGYALIGLREPVPELFREMPWSGPEIHRRTLERARALGLRVVELEPWFDVDDLAGLERLRRDLERPAATRRAPATARFLAGWGPAS
jgi:rSAM/selenodomain-associated transferase 1